MCTLRQIFKVVWLLFLCGMIMYAALPSNALALFGKKIDSFTADQVDINPSGKVISTSTLYITPDKLRIDGMPGGAQEGIPEQDISMFMFKKKNQYYIYNHTKKLFHQSVLDEEQMNQQLKNFQDAETQEVIGKEKVSGYKCTVKRVTTAFTMMGMTTTTTMTVWQSDQFEMPLRTRMENGSITEIRNIKKGAPKKKVFKLPKGYQEVGMMQVMGMDFGSFQPGSSQGHDTQGIDSDAAAGIQPPGNFGQQDSAQNMDLNQMMEAVQQAMGDMDPEQAAQMQQAMQQAMNMAGQIKEGPGAADGLWQLIPKRPKDKIVSETYTPNTYHVTMGTQSSLDQVFSFYEKKLIPKGWQDGGRFTQGGSGHFMLTRTTRQVMISSTGDPGTGGGYKLFYNIQMTGPDI